MFKVSLYLPDHLLLCGTVIVVQWLFYGVLRFWLQCLLVERPLYHRRGPSVDTCIMQVAMMRMVLLIETTMDTWDIWTHTQKRYPFASWNRLALAVVTLCPEPNMNTLGVCVCLHTSACVLGCFLEHCLCVSCYIVLRSTFFTSGLLYSTSTHGNDSEWDRCCILWLLMRDDSVCFFTQAVPPLPSVGVVCVFAER